MKKRSWYSRFIKRFFSKSKSAPAPYATPCTPHPHTKKILFCPDFEVPVILNAWGCLHQLYLDYTHKAYDKALRKLMDEWELVLMSRQYDKIDDFRKIYYQVKNIRVVRPETFDQTLADADLVTSAQTFYLKCALLSGKYVVCTTAALPDDALNGSDTLLPCERAEPPIIQLPDWLIRSIPEHQHHTLYVPAGEPLPDLTRDRRGIRCGLVTGNYPEALRQMMTALSLRATTTSPEP